MHGRLRRHVAIVAAIAALAPLLALQIAVSGHGETSGDTTLHGTTVTYEAGAATTADNITAKEVAAMLGLSTRTVESHVAAVLRKLHLANRHQLAHWAAQRRLSR